MPIVNVGMHAQDCVSDNASDAATRILTAKRQQLSFYQKWSTTGVNLPVGSLPDLVVTVTCVSSVFLRMPGPYFCNISRTAAADVLG